MNRQRIAFLFLNIGHLYDHMFMLLFATVAALALAGEWQLPYAELLFVATPGFVAFGLCALPAGWLADKWSRPGMMLLFFTGMGATSLLAGFANSPFTLGAALFLMGCFASIYHPVGIAMVVQGRDDTGVALAINGVWGNLGVGVAALVAGMLIDVSGWRAAFLVPGAVGLATAGLYGWFLWSGRGVPESAAAIEARRPRAAAWTLDRATLLRIFAVVFFSTACGSFIYQSMTFSLPKVFDERIAGLSGNASGIGGLAFLVFAVAAVAQVVVGRLIDRHSIRTVFMVTAGLQVPLYALMTELAGLPALVGSLAFMLLMFGQIPINDTLVSRITHSEWRSRVYGLKFVITFLVMAGALPLVGWLHEQWGFGAVFAVMACVATAMFGAVNALPRGGPVLARAPAPATDRA